MADAFISESSYGGSIASDFVEVSATTGTDVTGWTLQVYDSQGYIAVTMVFPTATTTEAGRDVYLFEQGQSSWPNLADTYSVAIIDDTGSVVQFISYQDPPATAMDGDAAGSTPTYVGTTAARGESLQSDDGGTTYYTQSAPNPGTVPCFAPGSQVLCADGLRAVEDLRPGDKLVTRDHGLQHIVWVRSRFQVFSTGDPSDRPVLIKAGALARGVPGHDLVVSPQHRVVFRMTPESGHAAPSEVLAPAKALVSHPGVRLMRGKKRIVWHHFACARHELVLVNGCWTETLLLGPMAFNGLDRIEQLRLRAVYPGAATADGPLNGPPARRCLSVGETKRGLARRALAAPAHA